MTSPKAHKLCFSLSKERRNGGSVIFPPSEMWKHIGRSHLTKIPNCAHVNFTATLDKVFSPSPLLNCGGIISRSVVYAGKSWKNKRKQWGAWYDTTSTFKTQTKTPRRDHAASETNERKTDCRQISIPFSKVRYIFRWGIVCKWYIEYVRYNCKQTCNLHRLQSVPWSLFILSKKAGNRPLELNC